MEAVFLKIINMSITSLYIIPVVLAARFLLRKAPKKYAYFLWSVVGFRLCCPVSFQSIFSLFSLQPFDMTKAQSSSGLTLDYIKASSFEENTAEAVTTGIPSLNRVVTDNISASAVNSINPKANTLEIALYIWATVFGAMLIYAAISYIILNIRLSKAILLEKNVYQSDKVQSPFILGIFRPKIYIPFGLDENVRKYVLSHEKYHLKRLDYIIKPFAFILLAIHWFNPLCWIAFRFMSNDMEMSCDEKVLSKQSGIKKAYSTAILSFASGNFHSPGLLSFSKSGTKRRIKNILSYKKPELWFTILAAVICAVVLVSCTSNPMESAITQETQPTPNTYTAGKCIAQNGHLSRVILNGADYGNIDITKSEIMIETGKYGTFRGEASKSHEYTRSKLIKKIDNELTFPSELDNYIPDEYKEITQIKYSNENSDEFYMIYWYKDTPLFLYDGLNCFELLPVKNETDGAKNISVIDDTTINELFDAIENNSEVLYSSSPSTYISASPEEYELLISYGDNTLKYIFREFLKGGQTGLKGHLMRIVMDDLIGNEKMDIPAETGQEYFDSWYDAAKEAQRLHGADYMKTYSPKAWLLLQSN